jgi:hypothetical protein
MPCCTCCCVKLNGECCGPDGNKVCCKDPDVCCGTGESQVCCEAPRDCCTVYAAGVGESEVCCTETQYCCNDGQGVCCENDQICCPGPVGAVCCEVGQTCCDGVCCPEGECCVDDACVPCAECESDEDCPGGGCCNDGVCGECGQACNAEGIADLNCPCEVYAEANWNGQFGCPIPGGWSEFLFGGERRVRLAGQFATPCYGPAYHATAASAAAALFDLLSNYRCVWPNDGSPQAGQTYAPAIVGNVKTNYGYCCDGQCQAENCDSPP